LCEKNNTRTDENIGEIQMANVSEILSQATDYTWF